MIRMRTHNDTACRLLRERDGEFRGGRRPAFTIIELLIVVGIMLILTTFTIVAIDFTFQSERIGSGARQVQSMISGARDRAIRYRKPIGVRFLVDQDADNGRLVSSMVYVGATDYWREGHITLKRPDFNSDGTADDDRVIIVDGDAQTRWNKLRLRGFLGIYEDRNTNGVLDAGEDLNANGVLDRETPRIKIPGDKNGTWYRVMTHLLGNPGVPASLRNSLQLVREFRDPGTTPPSEVIAFEGTGHNTYLLELPPRVLPDAEPILLPDEVVIDLDASVIPVEWRPDGGGYTVACSSRMDLMFSPRGTVTGSAAGLGVLHFYLALRQDVENCRFDPPPPDTRMWLRRPTNGSAPPLVPADGLFDPVDGIPNNNSPPVGDRALVTLFASTGRVASYPINPQDGEDTNGNGILDPGEDRNGNGSLDGPNGYLDDPFVYAELGENISQ